MAHSTVSRLDGPRPADVGATARPVAVSLLLSLRPSQWTKNLFVFGALLFGQRGTQPMFLEPLAIAQASAAFVIFCALSGVVYLINDVADRESDRLHPVKRTRPVASGAITPSLAITAAVGLGVAALGAAYLLRPTFAIVAATYLGLLACYSFALKHMVIIDVLTIAIGFVLRAAAGAVAIAVPISHWLLILIMLLALFLALSKRRHELVLLADGASSHRRILQEYSPYLLDQMIGVVTASTLVSYVIYSVSPETVQKFHTDWLGLTLVFPLYGIFRYLYLVHRKEGGGSPSDMLQNDRPLLACVALWALSVAAIIYGTSLLNA